MATEIFKSDFFEKLVIKMNAPKLKDKTNFFRLLATSQKAGLWIMDSLNSLKISEKNKWLRIIIKDLMNQLSQWVSLADAMSNHDYFFDADEIELVRSSQVAWNLVWTLYDIAEELEEQEAIRQKMKKALTYPIILIVVAIVAVSLLLVYAIPSIVSLFSDYNIPKITLIMLSVSNFLKKYWLLLIIWIFWLVMLYKFLYKAVLPFKVFIDKLVISLPISSWAIKTYYMYKFAKLLSQFYAAWISPVVSLWLISNIFNNFEYKKKLIEIKRDLASWFTFFESMDWSKLFDPVFIQIMHVWEDTGTLWDVLARISSFYRDQFESKLDILMSLLEPALMVVMAWMIWVIVAAVYIPMVSVIEII